MTVENDTTDTDAEWQFTDLPSPAADEGGGGLLRQILDEVTAMRANAAADRVALAEAITGSLGKIEGQLLQLRDDLAAVRADVDASGKSMTESLTPLFEAEAADVARAAAEIRHLRVSLIGPD
jgi:hypothetical protein